MYRYRVLSFLVDISKWLAKWPLLVVNPLCV